MSLSTTFSGIEVIDVSGDGTVVISPGGKLIGASSATKEGKKLVVSTGSSHGSGTNISFSNRGTVIGSISSGGISISNNVITAYGSKVGIAPKKLTITTASDTILVVNGKTVTAGKITGQSVVDPPKEQEFFLDLACRISTIIAHSQAALEISDCRWIGPDLRVDLQTSGSLKMPPNVRLRALSGDASTSAKFEGSQMITETISIDASTSAEFSNFHCTRSGRIDASTGAIIVMTTESADIVRVNKSTGARVVSAVSKRSGDDLANTSKDSRKRKDASSELSQVAEKKPIP